MLFQLFINDIVNLGISSKIILYADDAVIYNHNQSIDQLILEHQSDLDIICNWLQFNKLTVNAKKSQYMMVSTPRLLRCTHNRNLPPLKIGNSTLQRVASYEYLGICIDESLLFNKALSSVYGRTSNKLYMLGLLRKHLSVNSAFKIFKAMVLPYMEYIFFCISPCNDKDLTKLQRLQNRGARICLRLPP